MKIKKLDYLGLNHEKINEKFEGDLTFVNYMNIKGATCAVYHAKNPNREKGHKEYLLIYQQYNPLTEKSDWFVSGMEKADIKKYSKMDGLLCIECDTFLFSMSRHDYHTCGCENDTMVDGGTDYFRAGAKSLAKTVAGKINLLTDKVVLDSKSQKR